MYFKWQSDIWIEHGIRFLYQIHRKSSCLQSSLAWLDLLLIFQRSCWIGFPDWFYWCWSHHHLFSGCFWNWRKSCCLSYCCLSLWWMFHRSCFDTTGVGLCFAIPAVLAMKSVTLSQMTLSFSPCLFKMNPVLPHTQIEQSCISPHSFDHSLFSCHLGCQMPP